MAGFLEATEPTRCADIWTVDLDPEWAIWGPFGGYLSAIAMRSIAEESSLSRPATLTCQFLNRGTVGPATIEVTTLKSGRRAECLQAILSQERTPLLRAVAWIVADDLDGLEHDQTAAPQTPGPAGLAPYLPVPGMSEEQRRIWDHIERRPVTDNRAMWDRTLGVPDPVVWSCWHRLVDELSLGDYAVGAAQAALLTLTDAATWPAVLLQHGAPTNYVAPTLELAVQFHARLYTKPRVGEWSLVEARSRTAGGGLLSGSIDVWSQDGDLDATAITQCLCRPRQSQT